MGLFSKITKPFKKIAKRVKKTASKVWKGIKTGVLKPLGKLYGKTFGKLGPLGMVAASLILPGIGSMISAGWSGLAGSLAANNAAGTFLHAVGTGMQGIATTLGNVGAGISEKINMAMDKGKDLFGQAQSWVTGGGDPAKFAAKQVSESTSSLLQANPELVGASNAQARNQFASITNAQKAQAVIGDEATKMALNPAQQNLINERFAQTSGLANKTLLQTTGETLATPQVLAKDLNLATQGRAAGPFRSSSELGNWWWRSC